ncbi:MAG: DEAD/DEAH box helicase [Candidatus Latescibacteria bacterium]|jgi:SNF2 family DNA or RNA helicase|nr:DEAD/DEAH box helicase [Candidatus Latescibacterota bacterium]
MSHQTLDVIILPNGSLFLEFVDTTESFNEASSLSQRDIFRSYNAEPETWFLLLGFRDRQVRFSSSLDYWRDFSSRFIARLSRIAELEELRGKATVEPLSEDEVREFLALAPMMTGVDYLTQELLKNLWSYLHQAFRILIERYDDTVEAFFKTYSPETQLAGRVFFHLVENAKGDDPFAFLATYSTRVDNDGASRHLPLKHALQEYDDDRERLLNLLSTVHTAAHESSLLEELLESGELFHPLSWSSWDAYEFLKDIPIYERSGILCRIPNWWTAKASQTRIDISVGDSRPSHVGMDALLSAAPRLFLGDTEISENEARRLLRESEGLAFLKNRWVAVDPEKLKQALEAYDKAKQILDQEGVSIRDILRLQLNPDDLLGKNGELVEVGISNGEWLNSVTQKLINPNLAATITPPNFFKADLRVYQQEGLNWLVFLDSLGFGACLADDMGLGKTIQILAFLSTIKKRNPTSLLIIPASLISNWRNEIERFAPDLAFYVAHPEAHQGQTVDPLDELALDSLDLVITTYTLAQKYEWLQSISWDYVILDEAQAIKNPGTKQTRAIKKLNAANRIILTGTPVENRLSDLWSLFDFLNPGLLGNTKEFKSFCQTLKKDSSGYSRLRGVISPYTLRRLKTDRSVITDLPDKIEMKTYASLSKKQVVLYEDLVEDIKDRLERTDGIQRRGIILSSLMKFKQLCNHPDQYLGTGAFHEKDSGKFSRLREICETIFEKREKALIFTQFKEMTQPLHDFMAGIFGRNGLVLHGSVPVKKRKDLIESFQDTDGYTPFMVLSLKAGGVGLNLTEANHVVHFDRWWNPAVENQATDRAFRIGQKKNVMVHKFQTQGTIEEKIDAMLVEKSELFDRVITSAGEGWITEMENEELMEMFRLRL